MKGESFRRGLRPSPALVISMLALFVAIGGGAYAASKVGKNKVVTKSIKNGAVTEAKIRDGAVTGSKVADGSIATADLAPGSFPASGTGSLQFAASGDISLSPNFVSTRSPVGSSSGALTSSMFTPVEIKISGFQASGNVMGIGQARFVALDTPPYSGGTGDAIVGCTIGSGESTCSSSQTGTIPAGSAFAMIITNGPGGAAESLVRASYEIKR